MISATVGLCLRVLEGRSRWKSILAGVLGVAWTLISYFVIPIMIFEDKNPIQALKGSKELLQKTWGEQLIGIASFGLMTIVLAVPGVIAFFLFGVVSSLWSLLVSFGLMLGYLCLVALMQSALQSIFQVAIYRFARYGKLSADFPADVVKNSIVSSNFLPNRT